MARSRLLKSPQLFIITVGDFERKPEPFLMKSQTACRPSSRVIWGTIICEKPPQSYSLRDNQRRRRKFHRVLASEGPSETDSRCKMYRLIRRSTLQPLHKCVTQPHFTVTRNLDAHLVSTGINADHFVYFNHGTVLRFFWRWLGNSRPSVMTAEPWLCLGDP